MTTFADLKTECATRFRDVPGDVISTTQWGNYINQAYKAANATTPLWPWMESAEATVTVLANTRDIALPSNVVQVNWAYNVTDDYPLVPQEGRGDQWRTGLRSATGKPTTYKIQAGKLALYPMVEANTAVAVEAITLPAVLTGTDLPVWPVSFHEILIPGALALAYLDDGNIEHYRAHQAQFDSEVRDMLTSLLMFRTEANAPIRDTFFG